MDFSKLIKTFMKIKLSIMQLLILIFVYHSDFLLILDIT